MPLPLSLPLAHPQKSRAHQREIYVERSCSKVLLGIPRKSTRSICRGMLKKSEATQVPSIIQKGAQSLSFGVMIVPISRIQAFLQKYRKNTNVNCYYF